MTCNLKTQSPELYLSLFLSGRQSVKKIFLIFPSSRLLTSLAPLIWFPRTCRCRRISTLIILMGITCLTVNVCTQFGCFSGQVNAPFRRLFIKLLRPRISTHSCRLLWINQNRRNIYLFLFLVVTLGVLLSATILVCVEQSGIYWGCFFFLRVIYVSLFHYWTHQLCITGTLNIVFHCSFSQ